MEAKRSRTRNHERATEGAAGARLAAVWKQHRRVGPAVVVPTTRSSALQLTLEPGDGQSAPLVVATASGTVELVTYRARRRQVAERSDPAPFEQTLELELQGGRYLIVGSRGPAPTCSPCRP